MAIFTGRQVKNQYRRVLQADALIEALGRLVSTK